MSSVEFLAVAPQENAASLPRPVSEIQRRFLAAEARYTQLAPHLQRSVCLLPRGMDLVRLRQAFALVNQLQDAFRTSFQRGADLSTFTQKVDAEGGLQIVDRAFNGSSEALVRALTQGDLFEQLHAGIDPFGAPPLARGHLLHMQDGLTALVLSVHHAIFDGSSAAALFGQLIELIRADKAEALVPQIRGRFAPYAAFVRHEQLLLSGERLEALQRFWRGYLADPPKAAVGDPSDAQALGLPNDVQATEIELSIGQVEGLNALAQAHRLTPHLLLLACMQWAIAASSGELDVLTSTPTRNRPSRFAETIGCFVNPVIVRQRVDLQSSMLDNLAQLRTSATAAYRNGAMPAARVMRELFPELMRQRIPLARSWFAIQVSTADVEVQDKLQLRILNLASGRAMGAAYALELQPEQRRLRGPFLTRRHFDPGNLSARLFSGLVSALLRDLTRPLGQVISALNPR